VKKVMIIGCGGSGKSTLAMVLQKSLGLPVYHLDRLFWKPGWIESSKEEWKAVHEKHVSKPQWIIDGNYGGTMEVRFQAAEAIIFLDLSTASCLWGAVKRYFQHRGTVRPDMTEGCHEKIDWEFLMWIWRFRGRQRPNILARLQDLDDSKQVFILDSRKRIAQFLEESQTSTQRSSH
jgi:adenylate kinase family enzyme